jgi:hypothetical protein
VVIFGIVDAYVNLVPGSVYYLQADGSLATRTQSIALTGQWYASASLLAWQLGLLPPLPAGGSRHEPL